MLRKLLILACLAGAPGTVYAETYLFSAPPLPDAAQSRSLYGPLMELLSRETGETFRYVHAGDWFAYQSDMQSNRFDLLLDDAHFASWRIAARGHVPLAAARPKIHFVVVATRAGRIYSKEDLVARPLCAHPLPDLGTLAVLQSFDGPFQIPRIVEMRRPLERVQRVLTGECAGAVVPRYLYTGSQAIRRVAEKLKIVTQTNAYPGTTLTAGNRVPESLRSEIRRILLSRAGGRATRQVRERLGGEDGFVEVGVEAYVGLDELLSGYPGFEK